MLSGSLIFLKVQDLRFVFCLYLPGPRSNLAKVSEDLDLLLGDDDADGKSEPNILSQMVVKK